MTAASATHLTSIEMRDSLNLANLPSDILRVIIKVADLNYFDAMRKISPQWNTSAFFRAKLPHFNEICIFRLSPTFYELNLLLPPEHTRYFGIPNWTVKNYFDKIFCVRTCSLMRDNSNSDRYLKYIEHVAGRCSHIQKFKLDDSIDLIDDISDRMGEVVVKNADLLNLRSFEDGIITKVFDFVLTHSVQQLHLSFYQMDWRLYERNLATFLNQAIDLNFAIVIDLPDNEEKYLTYCQAMVLEQIPADKDRKRVEISVQRSPRTFHVRLSVARGQF